MSKFNFADIKTPPSVAPEQWLDWKWQMRKSLKSKGDFVDFFDLSGGQAFQETHFKYRCSPYYAELARQHQPIQKIVVPEVEEKNLAGHLDPLAELENQTEDRIIHRYPDRVLFLLTDICNVYCRYCTRKHFTGKEQALASRSAYEKAMDYIRERPGIREVILSGGDPLTVDDKVLDKTLSDLREIPHLEIIRIGSRMPVVNPMRVTPALVEILRRHKPVFMMTHFNHPAELTLQSVKALELLVDHGVPVFNQMVLLNGVNNHSAIVQALARRLLYLRVKPYYLFQCDPSQGTDHLRVSIEQSEQIQRELWGNLSGLAMPNLSLDIPGGGGKVALVPSYETGRFSGGRSYTGFDGVSGDYLVPPGEPIAPDDVHLYQTEWEEILNAKKAGLDAAVQHVPSPDLV